jgi:stress-induced-phosphoprotein 1
MVLFAMKDYSKAMEAASEASVADTEHKHTAEIDAHVMKINQEVYSQRAGETDEQTLQRAMRDPEVAVSRK